jgi:hypothetical protein
LFGSHFPVVFHLSSIESFPIQHHQTPGLTARPRPSETLLRRPKTSVHIATLRSFAKYAESTRCAVNYWLRIPIRKSTPTRHSSQQQWYQQSRQAKPSIITERDKSLSTCHLLLTLRPENQYLPKPRLIPHHQVSRMSPSLTTTRPSATAMNFTSKNLVPSQKSLTAAVQGPTVASAQGRSHARSSIL